MLGELCLVATEQPDDGGVTRGETGPTLGERSGEREREGGWGGEGKVGGDCHGEGSQRARGEQRCLGDDCRCARWSKPFSLTYTPGFTKTEIGGGSWDSGVQSTSSETTRDLVPACPAAYLSACLSECRSVSSITDRGVLFNKIQTQAGAHARAHKDTHAWEPATAERERGNKGQAVPPSVFIKEKSDQIN